ncbi:MAG: VPLPA-CTERM sorting domain-containing protein [Pseudomonadota bacterium]
MLTHLTRPLATACALTLFSTTAHAITVDAEIFARADLDALVAFENPIADTTNIGSRARAGVYENVAGSERLFYGSPWSRASSVTAKPFEAPFTAVRAASATYNFAEDQTGFSLLWGTAGRRDTITLFNDGVEVATISTGGADVSQTRFAQFVTVSDVVFDSIEFANDRGVFEFANLQTVAAAVPLPAGGMLLLTGLGAAAMMRRRQGARSAKSSRL